MEWTTRVFRMGTHNQYEIQVATRGNFSTFSLNLLLNLNPAAIVIDIFSQFEEQLNLKITFWKTLKAGSDNYVIFRHEPKEKAKVASTRHEYEIVPDDPDIKL